MRPRPRFSRARAEFGDACAVATAHETEDELCREGARMGRGTMQFTVDSTASCLC